MLCSAIVMYKTGSRSYWATMDFLSRHACRLLLSRRRFSFSHPRSSRQIQSSLWRTQSEDKTHEVTPEMTGTKMYINACVMWLLPVFWLCLLYVPITRFPLLQRTCNDSHGNFISSTISSMVSQLRTFEHFLNWPWWILIVYKINASLWNTHIISSYVHHMFENSR